MKRLTIFVLFAIALITMSCNNSTTTPTSPNNGDYLMQLHAGGSMVDISYPGSDTITISRLDSAIVGPAQMIQNTSCSPVTFFRSVNGSAWVPGSTYYLFNRSDGLYTFVNVQNTMIAVRSIKYPVSVGDSLQVGYNNNYWATMYCQSVTDTVTVPAGTFTNCIRNRVVSTYNNTTSIVWHKPGYGELRQVFYNTTTGALDSLHVLYRTH